MVDTMGVGLEERDHLDSERKAGVGQFTSAGFLASRAPNSLMK
jgi:hypothetical protein